MKTNMCCMDKQHERSEALNSPIPVKLKHSFYAKVDFPTSEVHGRGMKTGGLRLFGRALVQLKRIETETKIFPLFISMQTRDRD